MVLVFQLILNLKIFQHPYTPLNHTDLNEFTIFSVFLHKRSGLHNHLCPADLFTILELRNPTNEVFEMHQIR